MEEYESSFVTLLDEDGNEQEFEHLDTVEFDGNTFVALLPVCDPEELLEYDGELLILRLDEGEEGDALVTIDDDDLYDRVAALFEERLEDEYEIVDADEFDDTEDFDDDESSEF